MIPRFFVSERRLAVVISAFLEGVRVAALGRLGLIRSIGDAEKPATFLSRGVWDADSRIAGGGGRQMPRPLLVEVLPLRLLEGGAGVPMGIAGSQTSVRMTKVFLTASVARESLDDRADVVRVAVPASRPLAMWRRSGVPPEVSGNAGRPNHGSAPPPTTKIWALTEPKHYPHFFGRAAHWVFCPKG